MSNTQYADANYRGGQHGFFAFGLEPGGMIAPDADTLPAGPTTLKFAGYAGVPGIENPQGTQPVRGAGSPRPLKFIPGLKQPTISNTLTLGSGANVLELLRYFLRADTTIDSASRHMCLPVVAVSGGAFDPCGTALNYHWQGRCAMGNTLSMNVQNGQAATAQVNFWPVCIDKSQGDITGLTDAALKLAGGEVYAYQHLQFAFGSEDFTDIIENCGVSINNNLSRGPMRTLASCAGSTLTAKKANSLYRAARQIKVGSEDIQLNLGLLDKLPDTYDGESNMGTLSFVLSNEIRTITFSVATNFLVSHNQNQTGAEAPMGFAASIMSSDITLTTALIS